MHRSRILLLDSSHINLTYYRAALRSLPNVEITGTTNPAVALALLYHEYFDVAVIDYRMPEGDGLSVIREAIRGERGAPLTVLLTVEADCDVRRAALAAGVTDFLIKPIDDTELYARIRNMVALAKARCHPQGVSSPESD